MDNRPEFWDFYRAYRKLIFNTGFDSYLVVRNKKQGTTSVYYTSGIQRSSKSRGIIITQLLIIVSFFITLIFFSSPFGKNPWNNLIFELGIVYFIIEYILELIRYKLIYKHSRFDIVPEDEWEASVQKRKKARWGIKVLNSIGKAISVVLILFLLLNTYFFTYIRYLVNGGPKNAVSNVRLGYEGEYIELDETVSGTGFNIKRVTGENDVRVNIDVLKYPGDIDVYINGEKVIPHKYRRYSGMFWDETYFENSINLKLNIDIFKDSNKLEIKDGNDFYKSWTFAIKYE